MSVSNRCEESESSRPSEGTRTNSCQSRDFVICVDGIALDLGFERDLEKLAEVLIVLAGDVCKCLNVGLLSHRYRTIVVF
jgi:hypothetical protein